VKGSPFRPRGWFAALAGAALAACGGGGSGGGDGGGPLNITTATAADGMIGAAYSETIVATGGRGAQSFNISVGALPDGLAMSAAGAITGTPSGPVGTAEFTVTVTDSAGKPATDSQALSITIVEPLEITTVALAGTAVGESYNASVAAAGGTPPYTFGISAGDAPAGIAMAADGTVSGTVAASANTETFTVEVADSSSPPFTATQEYTIIVQLEIATGALADATGGVEYLDALVARGGVPPYSWTLTAGSLPAGLALGADGIVSGTPDALCAATNTSLSVDLTDGAAPPETVSRSGIDLTVNPAALVISTAALPGGRIDAAYNQQILASGGVPPYAFEVTDGVLPSQLSLNAGNGRITGTPDTIETQTFEITVTDTCPGSSAQRDLSLTISPPSLGRNDSIATATVLPGNGNYQASISPSGHPNSVFDPDEDYYEISTTATSTITIDINAAVDGSPLDSVIEVVNAAGNVLNLCGTSFNAPCVHDDEVLGVDLDSILQLRVTGATTFYIHVVDWASDARPDKLYDLVISGVN
jgi:hypothetical protein